MQGKKVNTFHTCQKRLADSVGYNSIVQFNVWSEVYVKVAIGAFLKVSVDVCIKVNDEGCFARAFIFPFGRQRLL